MSAEMETGIFRHKGTLPYQFDNTFTAEETPKIWK